MGVMNGRGLIMRGVVLVLVCVHHRVHAMWWHLGLSGAQLPTVEEQQYQANSRRCADITYLGPKQQELCRVDNKLVHVITKGAAMGINECQHQFYNRRWNCSVFNETNIFGNVLTIKSKETAYIYSIFSSGIMHSVTKACSRGELDHCGCDMKVLRWNKKPPGKGVVDDTSGEFEWGGCSDNTRYSKRFSRDFVDNNESRSRAEGLMNLWNNEAGRQAVKNNMETKCKCHGVSGSCAKKICWRSLSSFRKIGTELQKKSENASKVRLSKHRPKLKKFMKNLKSPKKSDLVYLHESPDFCERDLQSGILGTRRRPCNKSSNGMDGCVLMCCGRGYYTIIKEVVEDCDCKFFWCCKVECKKCKMITEEHHCN